MTVTVTREDGRTIAKTVTWSDIYDDDMFYFKAGNYNQNRGGDTGDYAQSSFYSLSISHD